ncbi:HEXXH motif-containing putative peptide modification protein [Streptomyces sp. NPDC006335]|uniref:aKG-HExxH-type peptide beta-hydroxylase n=1 Tax=Streptomyces sp. NPDC006335 TaxID=3156895 RepID=UPI0033AC076E
MASVDSFIQREFCGFPFLDLAFSERRLLTAVACVRWNLISQTDSAPNTEQLQDVLRPQTALSIRRRELELPIPGSPLPADHRARIDEALAAISETIPEWKPLLQLPVRFLRLDDANGAIGASCYAWPQHILLGDDAFASPCELAEQVLHEISHNWLYLVEELRALQHHDCGHTLTLPSGTGGRDPDEILGAVHVVLNVRRLWSGLPVPDEQRQRRLEDLDTYLEGCLPLLDAARTCLTEDGQALADRLLQEAVAA